MVLDEKVLIDPIDYSQQTCGDHFMDGRPVDDTVRMLEEGFTNPLSPPFSPIEVVKNQAEQRYISKDHRRLWCLKEHQQHSGRHIRTKVRIIADVYDQRAFEKLCDRYSLVNQGRAYECDSVH